MAFNEVLVQRIRTVLARKKKNESGKTAKKLISVAPAGLEKMFFEFGVPLPEGATTALPPTKEEIEKLMAIAPRYGITLLPGH
jgi:hypothetical protein